MGQKCYKKLLIFGTLKNDKGRHFSTKHSNSSSAKMWEKLKKLIDDEKLLAVNLKNLFLEKLSERKNF